MNFADTQAATTWLADDLNADQSWIFQIDDKARAHLSQMVKKVFDPAKTLFDYQRADFDLGPAAATITAAFDARARSMGLDRSRS